MQCVISNVHFAGLRTSMHCLPPRGLAFSLSPSYNAIYKAKIGREEGGVMLYGDKVVSVYGMYACIG